MPPSRGAGGGGSSSSDEDGDDDAPLLRGAAKQKPPPPSRPQRSQRWLLGAMVYVASCFAFLFAGYSTHEILGTTFRGDLAYMALSCVYAGILPGSCISPAIVAKLGCKMSMALGAVPYTIYAGANWGVEVGLLGGWVLLPSGFAVGIGCGMLWGAQVKHLMRVMHSPQRT